MFLLGKPVGLWQGYHVCNSKPVGKSLSVLGRSYEASLSISALLHIHCNVGNQVGGHCFLSRSKTSVVATIGMETGRFLSRSS